MNKIQESFHKIIIQYVKETYPNDETLTYLLKGIDNFSDKNIQTEVEKPKYLCTPISESLLNDKDRIKEIMNKVLDVNFKPGNLYHSSGQIKKTITNDDDKLNIIEDIRNNINIIENQNITEETIKEIHKNNPMTNIDKSQHFVDKINPPYIRVL